MEQLKQESELVSKPPKSFKSDIKAYWQGHAPLAKAFWGLGIIGEPVFFLFIALFVALFFGLFILWPLSLFGIDTRSFMGLEIALFVLLYGTCVVFVLVSIWRCADSTNNKIWGGLARFYVIIRVIVLLILILFWIIST